MLLSSNVIYICVRVVMVVCMIRTRLFATVQVKSCPGMHSSCVIAPSLVVLAQLVALQYNGVAKKLIKGNYWPLNREHESRLSI